MGRRSFWHSTYLGNFVKTITYSSMKTRPTHKNIYYVNVPFPAFHSGLKQKQKKKNQLTKTKTKKLADFLEANGVTAGQRLVNVKSW